MQKLTLRKLILMRTSIQAEETNNSSLTSLVLHQISRKIRHQVILLTKTMTLSTQPHLDPMENVIRSIHRLQPSVVNAEQRPHLSFQMLNSKNRIRFHSLLLQQLLNLGRKYLLQTPLRKENKKKQRVRIHCPLIVTRLVRVAISSNIYSGPLNQVFKRRL